MDNGHEPVTRSDVATPNERTDALIERMDLLRSEIRQGCADLKEAIRDSHAELIRAFRKYT